MYYGSRAARLLQSLVEAYSPTFMERDAARLLVEEAWRLGYSQAYLDDAGNARLLVEPMERVEEPPRIALVSHIDTVPGWVEPASPPCVVRGRGAVDAKAPLAAMVAAASLYRPRRAVVEVVAAVGEEGPSHGAWHLVKTGWRADAVIIGEPTNTTKVAIGYRGGARLRVHCLGEPGHASSSWLYRSACSLVVEAYQAVEELSEATARGYTYTVTAMSCGSGGNVVADEATLVVDLRIPPGGSLEEALEKLGRRLPEGCWAEKPGSWLPPVAVRPGSPAARALMRGLLAEGYRAQPVLKAGTSDMNILYRVAGSIAAYGPGRSELSHTRHEEVTLAELDLAVRVYINAIRWLEDTLAKTRRSAG
ncbi:hypothetical protein CF15_07700 [Pyrodictium occultum]|uniref:Putative [LysW]-lysine/[LysW]-ornithine hydrolase n=1 Tax=Pyrodictium occultum TaxID=2309 RepID=A0A0V8RX22_PYROC|nr:M20/M25/M40 family metallo-hydrolase [Pyrodictium occultum]KSW12589.1 hypothetical protein CF15_07700 [Pyrodictium occultum]